LEAPQLTQGAACTTLLAVEHIDNDIPLLIANSDQLVDWDVFEFFDAVHRYDGGLVTFKASDPRWSYAEVDDFGCVTRVAEKEPISQHATTGIYYWRRGRDYVRFARQMIQKNLRVNNEFYVCPVFNEAIGAGLRIRAHGAKQMWGLGTPDDLEHYLEAACA
jgi:dTDP-glucose pyrophosphorylase